MSKDGVTVSKRPSALERQVIVLSYEWLGELEGTLYGGGVVKYFGTQRRVTMRWQRMKICLFS